MKTVLTILSIACAAVACAQLNPTELPIQDSMTRLRAQDQMVLQLDGSDVLGTKTTLLSTTAFWTWNSLDLTAPMYADIFEFTDGKASRRIVADGVTVFGYTNRTNSFTSNNYGAEIAPQPADFQQTLMKALSTEAQGTTVFIARFLREIYGGTVSRYSTWMPGAVIEGVYNGSSKVDPITGETYSPGANDFYVVYTYPDRIMRSAAFHLVRNDSSSPFDIAQIYYNDAGKFNGTQRLISWTLTVNALTAATTNFKFVPPVSARAIATRRGG